MTQTISQKGQGNPLGYEKLSALLKGYAIPSIIAMLVSSLYNIVDQIFIGQGVGYLGNAATNVSYPLTTICSSELEARPGFLWSWEQDGRRAQPERWEQPSP